MRDSSKAWTWVAVAGIVVGAALRLAAPGRWTLWCDELASLRRCTTMSVSAHLHEMRGNHPLYEVGALRPWSRVTTSDGGIRIPSAVAGALTLWLVWLVARGMGAKVGAASVWILACSPLHLMFSRLARPYALAGLWAALATWLLVVGLRRRRWWAFAGYGATAALMALTNLFACSLLVGQAGFLIWLHRRRLPRLAPWVGAGILFLALAAPWFAAHAVSAVAWSQATPYAGRQLGLALKAVYLPFTFALGETVHPLALWIVAPAAVGFGIASVAGLRQGWRHSLARLMLVETLVVFVAAMAFRAASPKHMLVAAPGFAMLLGAGVVSLRRRWLMTCVLVVILGTRAVSIANYFSGRDFHDADMVTPWRQMVSAVTRQEKPGEALLIGYRNDADAWRMFLRYYREAGGALKPVWLDSKDWRRELANAVRTAPVVWALLHEADPRDEVEKWMRARGWGIHERGFQMEEHTLRGLREGLRAVGKHRSWMYKLYRITGSDG